MRRADRRPATAVRAMAVIALLAGIGASPAQDATNASRWAAMSPTTQAEWQQRRLAWDALPRHERDDRRARYAAWRALDEIQRARLRAARRLFLSSTSISTSSIRRWLWPGA